MVYNFLVFKLVVLAALTCMGGSRLDHGP